MDRSVRWDEADEELDEAIGIVRDTGVICLFLQILVLHVIFLRLQAGTVDIMLVGSLWHFWPQANHIAMTSIVVLRSRSSPARMQNMNEGCLRNLLL